MLLLEGVCGVGKTAVVHVVAAQLGFKVFFGGFEWLCVAVCGFEALGVVKEVA